jgi:hypothetical protein
VNNFFTPIFRLAKHHPLPWVPLRAINMPIELRQACPPRHRSVRAATGNTLAVPMSVFFEPDDDATGLTPGSGTRRRSVACSVKVMLSAARSMHIAMLRRLVQAFFNNGAKEPRGVNAGNTRACPVQQTCVRMEY